MIMDVISQGPSNAANNTASKPVAAASSKPTAAKTAAKTTAKTTTTTNSRNKKSAVNDNVDEDDVSDEEMNYDKQSDSDNNEIDDELLARKLQEEESAGLRKNTRRPSKRPKAPKSKSEKSGDGTKTKRTNKYNEPCELSPELAAIVGEPQMPRHLVVKRMWEIVKERNLADPKNRQFMLCDDQLMTVFGRKKVRTFGMMKYLSRHMSSPNMTGKRRK